ncbi:hypothetical protein [Dyadobacter chenhuakuii]|uniref:Uncharacterized protein n=1 Tax=Dyadobacter chenhuakuii TaxID=2909339 RepID=A0A9X1TUA9_9BACT|nr:hypothetical protein [Dyadobacter chenhuakuii]MCF2499208.1 hypothetical protein [Dyadobacter chenhuakuii]
MKIKPMNITIAKNDLALMDLDGTRNYLDGISYNIRDIFHGNEKTTGGQDDKPVDIAEHLMNAMDIFTYALEELTHLEVGEEDLPKMNSIISSIRYIVERLRSISIRLEPGISLEYYALFLDKIEILDETIDDAEHVFFELRSDKDFIAEAHRLLGL